MALTDDWTFQLGDVVIGNDRPIKLTGFNPNNGAWRVVDQDNPVADSRLFGDDFKTPGSWELEVACLSDGGDSALDALAVLGAEWNKKYKDSSTAKLMYRRNGVTRFVYGRPRGFDPVPEKGIPDRLIRVSLKFDLADTVFYHADTQSLVLRMVPPSTGGFTAPFTAPIVTESTGEIQGVTQVVAGSDQATPVKIRFQGPVSQPYLEGDGWSVRLNMSLAYDQYVDVDARLYTVQLYPGGANMAGKLSIDSRLAKARINPFVSESLVFGGVDPTGTSTATVYWNPAYGTL